jgi:hypothetical protein
MTIKRLLILGGAALLAVGCTSDATSPTSPVNAEAAARGGKKKGPTTPGGVIMSMQASDSASCRGWPIVYAVADSSCTGEP